MQPNERRQRLRKIAWVLALLFILIRTALGFWLNVPPAQAINESCTSKPDLRLNFGPPDREVLSVSANQCKDIALPIIIHGDNSPDYDFVFYENYSPNTNQSIQLDWVELYLLTPDQGWQPAFLWNKDQSSGSNSSIASYAQDGASDNEKIPTGILYGEPIKTGILVDIDALGLHGEYTQLRIKRPSDGPGAAQIDAIEQLAVPVHHETPTTAPAPTDMTAPTDTPAPTDIPAPTDTPVPPPTDTPVPPPTDTPVPPPTDTPVPPPTDTPVPPTHTPVPPTHTPVPPPTDTPVPPPTDTPVPPTHTLKPPTDTPKPPTDTPKPPTDTPKPPTDTPKPPAHTPKPPTPAPPTLDVSTAVATATLVPIEVPTGSPEQPTAQAPTVAPPKPTAQKTPTTLPSNGDAGATSSTIIVTGVAIGAATKTENAITKTPTAATLELTATLPIEARIPIAPDGTPLPTAVGFAEPPPTRIFERINQIFSDIDFPNLIWRLILLLPLLCVAAVLAILRVRSTSSQRRLSNVSSQESLERLPDSAGLTNTQSQGILENPAASHDTSGEDDKPNEYPIPEAQGSADQPPLAL